MARSCGSCPPLALPDRWKAQVLAKKRFLAGEAQACSSQKPCGSEARRCPGQAGFLPSSAFIFSRGNHSKPSPQLCWLLGGLLPSSHAHWASWQGVSVAIPLQKCSPSLLTEDSTVLPVAAEPGAGDSLPQSSLAIVGNDKGRVQGSEAHS